MKIRRRNCEDLADYCELYNSWDPVYAISFDTRKQWVDNMPVERYEESFVYERDSRIVACVTLTGGIFMDKTVFWLELIVHPDYRGRGFARELYDTIEGHLNYLRWNRLYVECREGDDGAIAWLDKLGFTESSRYIESIIVTADFEKLDWFEDKSRQIKESGIEIVC